MQHETASSDMFYHVSGIEASSFGLPNTAFQQPARPKELHERSLMIRLPAANPLSLADGCVHKWVCVR